MDEMHNFPETGQQAWNRQEREHQEQYERIKRFASTLAPARDRVFKVSLIDTHIFRNKSFQTASWYEDVECPPQEHVVTAEQWIGIWRWSARLTGSVVKSHFPVRLGACVMANPGDLEDIGRPGEYGLTWDVHSLEHLILRGDDVGEVKGTPLRVERLA